MVKTEREAGIARSPGTKGGVAYGAPMRSQPRTETNGTPCPPGYISVFLEFFFEWPHEARLHDPTHSPLFFCRAS